MDYTVSIGQSRAVVVHCAQSGALAEQRNDALIYPLDGIVQKMGLREAGAVVGELLGEISQKW